MGVWFGRLWPEVPNPSLVEIEARQRAEAVVEQARRDVEIAQAELRKFMQENQESQQEAMKAQKAVQAQEHKEMMATLQAERAASEAAQAQAHKEMMMIVQAERTANEARLMAEIAANAASEEAKQKVAEAEEERKRIAAIQEHIQKNARASHEHSKKLEEVAKEEKREAIAAKEAANASKKAAVEELEKANVAREEAERKLAEGIQPLVTPTPDEVRAVKQLAQYREGLFHIAVAGASGGGKSSLINAFRGLRNMDINIGAAATGVVETTTVMVRCPDPNADYPYVWYDVPGAGTLKTPDWQYFFNDQGLDIYDCIIVLFDNRFTMTDIAVLTNCKRFKIPTYIVRSKADQHIYNIMKDMRHDSDNDEDRKQHYHIARLQFIQQTRQSVKDNLENANIPDQRVYIVSNETMLSVVKEKQPKVIDEIELLNDLIWEAQTRRLGRREDCCEEPAAVYNGELSQRWNPKGSLAISKSV